MRLLHGTTRARAASIVQHGPNINFVEAGGYRSDMNFCFAVEGIPSDVGDYRDFALGKARQCPDDRGPAVVIVEVPDEIVRAAVAEYLTAIGTPYNKTMDLVDIIFLCGNAVEFSTGPALNQLLKVWGGLVKEVRGVQ